MGMEVVSHQKIPEIVLMIAINPAPIAQLVEQWPLKPLVAGSSPAGGKIKLPY